MKAFEGSKWIWYTNEAYPDSYGEFRDELSYSGGNTVIRISADSDYTLWVNGAYAASGQYGDFEHYKIYDTVDITPFLREGVNTVDILVHYFGVSSSRYRPASAGLIYEALTEGKTVLVSGESTLCRESPSYIGGKRKTITGQLGLSFTYDATLPRDGEYRRAVSVKKSCALFPRPIKKHSVLERAAMAEARTLESGNILIDLGGETVGFPVLELNSPIPQTVKVMWGEHIEDGRVRDIIGGRDFSYEYVAHKGHNSFANYMLRLGCRYLEISSDTPVELIYCGVLPQVYEIGERSVSIADDLDRRIYDISVNTLRKCMMEHYVDCPWREQALYAFDSRNQMLCGYYAFEDGNREYARANLKLMGNDRRDDGLLSICVPSGSSLAIPSFSLYYITEMTEYAKYTSDLSLADELMPKLKGILDEFIKNSEDGLIQRFQGKSMWNFYDWTPHAAGSLGQPQEKEPDLFINCLFAISLDNFAYLCEKTGYPFPYLGMADELRRGIRERFLTEDGVFTVREGKDEITVLGNALAILAGAVTGEDAHRLCERIAEGGMVDCTLSMKILEYEALLGVNTEKYAPFVLDEIRTNYKKMLDYGHDTFWETMDGASAFKDAGSLCHGWSAVPAYIFHRLGIAVEK